MKKQKLLSMFVLLLMAAVQGEAQVTLKIPQWQKFVKVNKNASFKKAPNVKSATLWAEGGSTSVTFSWKKEEYMSKYYMPSFYQEICPVIKEFNGWYLVYICDGGQGLCVMEAYVQKSQCREVKVSSQQVTLDDDNIIAKSSKGWLRNQGYANSLEWAYIGTRVGNQVVWIDCGGVYEGPAIDFFTKHCGTPFEPKPSTLNDRNISEFLNSNTPRRYGIEYQFQDGHRETFWIEADSYKYPVNTIVI